MKAKFKVGQMLEIENPNETVWIGTVNDIYKDSQGFEVLSITVFIDHDPTFTRYQTGRTVERYVKHAGYGWLYRILSE